MRKSLLVLLGALALALPGQAAAPCPANPLAALSGTWTVNIQSDVRDAFPTQSYLLAGTFTASIEADRAGQPLGVLRINATSMIDHSSTRLEFDAGRYQINQDCSGGTLTFNLSSRPLQFDFWFYSGNQSINIISTTNEFPATGTAHVGVAGCPAGVADPLSLLTGPYAFRLQANWFNRADPVDVGYLIAGRFQAANGQLRITATSQLTGQASVTRLEQDAGSYQIRPDCTGGTLTFNLSSRPAQFEFYFRSGFDTIDIVTTTGPTVYGLATRAPLAGCPANPASVLTGKWTYNVHGILARLAQYSATGQFVASVGADRAGNPIGLLDINATSVKDLSITRLESDIGRFQLNDTCTGGTLTMNLSSFPQQYDFWFHNGGLFLISSNHGAPIIGGASKAPTACPVSPTGLNLLSGLWSFRTRNLQAVTGLAGLRAPAYLTQAGLINASVGVDRANNPLGVLAILATSITGFTSSVIRYESDAGRYTVNADCSGGTLTFNTSSQPVQFEYYFREGFNQFDAIGTSTNGPFVQSLFSR